MIDLSGVLLLWRSSTPANEASARAQYRWVAEATRGSLKRGWEYLIWTHQLLRASVADP